MPELNRRLEQITDSVIGHMTALCDALPGSINLAQGCPEHDPPKAILDALVKEAAGGPQHQYAVLCGSPNLRRCIADKYSPLIGKELDPEEEVVVTCGGTEAMMAIMMAICNEGDKVIIFSPFYECYGTDAFLNGAEPIYVPLVPPTYEFDPAVLEDAFKQGGKAIVVCNPNNPSGKVFTREELLLIEELAAKYDAFVITDEPYEHIVYAPYEHVRAASLPGAYERTITCNSLSKTFSITGWRIGFVIAPPKIAEAIKLAHVFLTVGTASPLQEAACAGFSLGQEYYDELVADYAANREIICGGLDEIGLTYTLPKGGFFVMVDITPFLEKPMFKGWSDLQFCEWMVDEIGVGATPGSCFFAEPVNNLIRLQFASNAATLHEAIERFKKLKAYL